MKRQSILYAVTIANLVLLIFLLMQPHRTAAQERAQVIRARGLEIVDGQGRVRAEIRIFPPDPNIKMPDGTKGYPETVLFRLITSKGGPNVKIAAVEDGSGISLGGEANPTNIQILARGSTTSLKLINQDGRQQLVKP